VPVALGVPVLARSGLLASPLGQVLAITVLAGLLNAAFELVVRPRRRLARRARQLAPGGACAGGDWAQIDTCLSALGRQRETDRARIRELEARLHRAQAAKCADTAKRAFLANIGHEIRTPMPVIVGMTRLSLKLATLPQQREHLLRADRAAQGLLTQISNLLDLVKLETGELRLVRSGFAAGDLLAQLVAAAAEQAAGKGLHLHTELDPRVPSALVGDADRLHQVLANLLDNALKLTDAGEVVLSCQLVSEAPAAEACVRFEVRGTGIGIPTDKQHTLFELFRQGDTSLTRRHGGSGLGLGLCYRLVQVMGGELRLDSHLDTGSSVYFELRLGVPGRAPTPPEPTVTAAHHDWPTRSGQIDLGTTRVRPRGSGRMLRRVLTRFKLDHGDFVTDYSSLHAVGDRFGAAQLARALQSAAASLGALGLREAASRLAHKRRADDDPSLDVLRVGRLLEGLMAEIDQRLAERSGHLPATTTTDAAVIGSTTERPSPRRRPSAAVRGRRRPWARGCGRWPGCWRTSTRRPSTPSCRSPSGSRAWWPRTASTRCAMPSTASTSPPRGSCCARSPKSCGCRSTSRADAACGSPAAEHGSRRQPATCAGSIVRRRCWTQYGGQYVDHCRRNVREARDRGTAPAVNLPTTGLSETQGRRPARLPLPPGESSVRSPFLQTFAHLPRELPIFPLSGAVVLPGVQLPLNIFEPRYLRMIGAALAEDHLIGMVQPRGDDTDDTPAVHRIGCAGRITSYSETADGRIVLVLTGLCRFQIAEELPARDGYRRVRPDWSRFAGDYDLEGEAIGNRERFMGSLRAFCDQRSVEVPWDRWARTTSRPCSKPKASVPART